MSTLTESEPPELAASPVPVPSRNASVRALATNALSGYVMLFAAGLVGFVCTPLLLHALGAQRFGVYSLIVSIGAYFGLVELGFGTATITRVAAAEHVGTRAISALASTVLAVFAVVAAVVAILAGVLALLLPVFFHIPPSLRSGAQWGFAAVGIGQAVTSAFGSWNALLLGTGRMWIVNVGGGLIAMGVSIATVVVAEISPSLPLIGVVQIAGALLTLALYRKSMLGVLSRDLPSIRRARLSTARELFALGYRNSVTYVMAMIAYGSDLPLVGILLTQRSVAAYAIALRGYQFMQQFANGALGAFGPAHAHRAATGDRDAGFGMFVVSMTLTIWLALLCALPVLIFAHGLLHLWLGSVLAGTTRVVSIFAAVLILQTVGSASANVMIHFEHPTEVSRIMVLSATVNIVASVILTATIGVSGPALGTVAALVLVDVVYLPFRACRVLGHSLGELITGALLPVIQPAICFAGLLWIGHHYVSHGLVILPIILVAVAAFAATSWLAPQLRDLRARMPST